MNFLNLLATAIEHFLMALNNAEVRRVAVELKNAKTVDEKREAAHRIADALYKR